MKITLKTQPEAEAFVSDLYSQKKFVISAHQLPENAGFEVQWIEHKNYVAHDGKEFPDEVWMTEPGDMVLIQDLEPEHARNVLRLLLRNEREARRTMEAVMEGLADQIQSGMIDGDEFAVPEAEQNVPHTLH